MQNQIDVILEKYSGFHATVRDFEELQLCTDATYERRRDMCDALKRAYHRHVQAECLIRDLQNLEVTGTVDPNASPAEQFGVVFGALVDTWLSATDAAGIAATGRLIVLMASKV